MRTGRPTDYTPELLAKAAEYIALCKDGEENVGTDEIPKYVYKVKLPSLEGLAVHLQCSREALYEWERNHPEFSDVLNDVRSLQADRLINNGLSGAYNSTIAKLILTKHGYTDKQDVTSDGKAIPQPILNVLRSNHSNEESSEPKEEN